MNTEPNAPIPTLVLDCGCKITTADPEPFTSFAPCSERHRMIAMLIREPGSLILIGKVQA